MGNKLQGWKPDENIDVEKFIASPDEVDGVFGYDIDIHIAKGGWVTLSIGGTPIGLITELKLEAAVEGELGNIVNFEVKQMKISGSDVSHTGFLTLEEFVAAQKGEGDDN